MTADCRSERCFRLYLLLVAVLRHFLIAPSRFSLWIPIVLVSNNEYSLLLLFLLLLVLFLLIVDSGHCMIVQPKESYDLRLKSCEKIVTKSSRHFGAKGGEISDVTFENFVFLGGQSRRHALKWLFLTSTRLWHVWLAEIAAHSIYIPPSTWRTLA